MYHGSALKDEEGHKSLIFMTPIGLIGPPIYATRKCLKCTTSGILLVASASAGFSVLADADETAGPGRCCHS